MRGTTRSRSSRSTGQCPAGWILCKEFPCALHEHRFRFCRLGAPVSFGGFNRFILHREVLGRARQAVIVRTAISDWLFDEVAMRRRRRREPLEGGRLPRIVTHFLAVPDAPEEIDDERNLREAHDPCSP